jgi:hypothetical protein
MIIKYTNIFHSKIYPNRYENKPVWYRLRGITTEETGAMGHEIESRQGMNLHETQMCVVRPKVKPFNFVSYDQIL